MITATIIGDIGLLIAGYAASIYTWPWLRTKLLGAETEAQKLRDRANAVISAARGQ